MPVGAPLERGQVSSSRPGGGLPTPGLERKKKKNRMDVSSVELADDDLVEVEDETLDPEPVRKPGGTRVRNAVNFPSGPLDISNPAASRPTQAAPAVAPPQHLAHMIANAPHVMEVARQQPSMTMRGPGPIAAALPTMAAAQPPMGSSPMDRTALGLPPPIMQAPPPMVAHPAAAARTLAIQAPDPNQPWAQHPAQVPPGYHSPMAEEPTMRPGPDAAMMEASAASAVASLIEPSHSSVRALKTGMRKGRSKLQIAIWLIIGAMVIAGGVVVGFKFRAMRLEKKIADTKEIALGLAKSDTWKGMVRSRDRLAGIAQASPTTDNRAALARSRALIAYEFGDGLPEAKTAIDGLAGEGGLDGELAAAYLALANNDAKAALEAAGRATKLAADDPAALYVTGQAELLAGDALAATKHLQAAVDKEGRPLYRVALSRAQLELTDYNAALKVIEPAAVKVWFDAFDVDTTRELSGSGIDLGQITIEHPAITTQRARVWVSSGQLQPGKVQEARGQLEKITAEGIKPLNDQPRGVSATQVALAFLAMSELDFVTNKQSANSLRSALGVGVDEQRFAEQTIETLFFTLDFATARTAADRALTTWPSSRRVRTALAQLLLVQGKPQEAIDTLAKIPDLDKLAKPLALRGRAKLALGDLAGAKADLDGAIEKSQKKLEMALVARAWVDLATNDVEAARTRIRARFQGQPTLAVTTVWAAILRSSGKPEDIKEAKELLEPLALNGTPSVDLGRAQLELARLYRDRGDPNAKQLYTKVIAQTGSREIQIETARFLIEFGEDKGGREMFDELLKGGESEPPDLLVEAARARMLVGDHPGGADLLIRAEKIQGMTKWKHERERGRLSLRKGDTAGAALLLGKALEGSGDDVETLFLAAEVAAADPAKFKELGDKVKSLGAARLREGSPEAKILTGKLLVKGEEAGKAYKAASDALGDKTAPPRRRAQAALGLAIVAYHNQDDPVALDAFELATSLDPTLYEAYIYVVDIQLGRKDAAKALVKAQLAVQYNPDNVDAYVMLGRVAAAQRNRKLLGEMLTKVGAIAPNSEQLKLLQSL
jgi:tetratricopeptide (TPR) repeat protein